MPDDEFNFKDEALGGHREQTRQMLAKIAEAETWFYTGHPCPEEARHVCDFIADVGDDHWLLFTDCTRTREEALRTLDDLLGQEHNGWHIDSVVLQHLVEDEILNVPHAQWVRLQNAIGEDGLFAERPVHPSHQWVECVDVLVRQNGLAKTFHLMMFGLNSYQSIVLMGAHKIFPKRVLGHPQE